MELYFIWVYILSDMFDVEVGVCQNNKNMVETPLRNIEQNDIAMQSKYTMISGVPGSKEQKNVCFKLYL